METDRTRRGRGRPPRSDGTDTRQRLLDAAAATCAEQGFDGATLHAIARRADVSTTAVYNHFDSRQALLYEAGRRGLRRMGDVVRRSGHRGFEGVALAYLDPAVASTRRLLVELHVAGRRDPQLAELLASWHATEAESLARHRSEDPDAVATAKALFLLLLGLCHLEDLDAVPADRDALVESVLRMVRALAQAG